MNKKFFFLKILSITLLFFFIFDLSIGKYLFKKFLRKAPLDVKSAIIRDEIYDHKFPKNYEGLSSYGNIKYKICTNDYGFRTSCLDKHNDKKYDIAFVGDSFTEGVGLKFEDTFTGIISKKLDKKNIINLGVSSYSPSIYFLKIRDLINQGFIFKEIIVFIDISDLVDETLCYKMKENKIVRRETFVKCFYNLNEKKIGYFEKKFKRHFKFSNLFIELLKKKLVQLKIIDTNKYQDIFNHSRAEWTYNYNKKKLNNYSLKQSNEIMLNSMNSLHDLLKENSIQLSLAVYPWPGTLYFDNENNMHKEFWENFCKKKCKKFYNFMPTFFNKLGNSDFNTFYEEHYIKGDVHYNKKGNSLIAEHFLDEYLNY